jgi:hypothetical protein
MFERYLMVLNVMEWDVLGHLPYSPDLTSYSCHTFEPLKKSLKIKLENGVQEVVVQ